MRHTRRKPYHGVIAVSDLPVPAAKPASVHAHGAATLILSTLLAGLAAGALWCLLGVVWDSLATWLIVPLAAAIGVYLRWTGIGGRRGAACATLAVLLAFVYAQYLFGAVRVADMLGLPLRNTLFKMDLGLAWQAVRANLGYVNLLALALGLASAWRIVLHTRIKMPPR